VVSFTFQPIYPLGERAPPSIHWIRAFSPIIYIKKELYGKYMQKQKEREELM
jgi:hypothetical protein